MEGNATREIEEAVQRALAAAGVEGTVTLSGRTMTLRAGGGAPTEIDAMYLLEQWPLLPDDLRERKAADVAARLMDANRAATAGVVAGAATAVPATRVSGAPGRGSGAAAGAGAGAGASSIRPAGAAVRGPSKPVVLPIGTVLLVAGLAAAGWWFWTRARPMGAGDGAGSGATTTAAPETAEQRDARLCETARENVLKNRSLRGIDSQVWLAELWLATSKPGEDMAQSKAVADLIDQGKLTRNADPELAALPQAHVEIANDESARAGVPWRGLHVRFKGDYVSAFFQDQAHRDKMNRVAAKLADATGAEMGALYGRCGHLRYHDIGAWFRGTTPSLAASSLVYAMGFFSQRPLTNHDPNVPPTGSDLAGLVTAMAKVDKQTIDTAVREVGGTYAPGATASDPTEISFVLGGPTLAARAAGTLATSAGRGVDSPRPGTSAQPPK